MLTGIKPFTALNVSAVSTKPNFTFYQFCLLCEVTPKDPFRAGKTWFIINPQMFTEHLCFLFIVKIINNHV